MKNSAATKLQNKVINSVELSIIEGKDAIIDSPTGSGKSRMFSKLAENGVNNGEKIIIFSHRKNLAIQAAENIKKWSDNNIEADVSLDGILLQNSNIVSSTIQTANENLDKLDKYDRAIFDEGHHAKIGNSDYEDIISKLKEKNPNIALIAVSATFPDQMNNMIKEFKNADKHVITFEEAINARLIDLPITKSPPVMMKNNKTIAHMVSELRGKDIGKDLKGIGSQIRKNLPDDWNETLVNHYKRNFSDKPALAYFDSIKEAEKFSEELSKNGIEIKVIHSGKKTIENEKAIKDFKNGKLLAIASVDMISEGVDLDAKGIMLAKLTTSRKDYRQIIGRESRSFGAKKEDKSVLLDMGASTYMHGEISAQAKINNIRKNIDSNKISINDLAPESKKARGIWVPLEVEGTYAAVIDGGILYASKNDNGYVAMTSSSDKNGAKLTLLEIEGQKKGRPDKDSFIKWSIEAIRRNEKSLARIITSNGGINAVIASDWLKNSQSVINNINLMNTIKKAMPLQINAQQGISI